MSYPKDRTMRLFFAFWPSNAERAALATWQLPLRELCGGRPMLTDTLHSTLLFLGDVSDQDLEVLRSVEQGIKCHEFEMKLTNAQYWSHNHIVYASPNSISEGLEQLVVELGRSLRQINFNFETRPYKPHVTLLRNAQWSKAELPPMPTVRWQVKDFVLVQSKRDEQGAHYELLARFPLLGAD